MFINFNRFLMNSTQEGSTSGGAGDPPAIDPKVLQAELDKYKNSTTNLEAKNQQLIEEMRKTKAALKNWDGLDPENVKALLSKFENDEDMKLIAAGKHDEVIKKRTEKMQAEYSAQLKTLQTELETSKADKQKYMDKVVNYQIDASLGSVFLGEGGHKTAIADFNHRARQIWKVEGDDLVPRDEKGEIIQGKKGILTPEEYIEKLKNDAPHLFPGSTGANTTGNKGNTKTAALDAKMEAARKAGNVEEMRKLRAEKNKIG